MNSSAPVLRQFDYRPRKWQTLALFLLAIAGAVLLTYFAVTLDQPIDVRGFHLNPAQGRILFGVFAALSPIGLFCLGAMVYVAFAFNRRVALTSSHLILPRPTRLGLSREEIEIPLDAIFAVSVHEFMGATKLLRLDYSGGVINIPSNMFRNRASFDDLCCAIREATVHATQGCSAS